MSDIDWSKAPEWSGAVVESASGNLYWVEEFGVKSRRQSFDSSEPDEHYIADMTLPDHGWRLVEVRTPHWTGTGLPPVGAVCEVFNQELHAAAWERCEILFAGRHRVVYDSESCSERVGDVEYLKFRPIRTPEQIAAEEREKAIDGMFNEANERAFMSHRELCAALYDAGYRKQEQPQ